MRDKTAMYLEERMNTLFEAKERAKDNRNEVYATVITNRLDELELLATCTGYEVRYNYIINKPITIIER